MADNLTNTAENAALNFTLGVAASGPTGTLKVALVTANGSDTTAGTEVTGGSYARKNLAAPAAANGSTSNSADLSWTGMPACTVVGVEVWDSATTPVRWWYGALTASQVIAAGGEAKITAGQLTFTLS